MEEEEKRELTQYEKNREENPIVKFKKKKGITWHNFAEQSGIRPQQLFAMARQEKEHLLNNVTLKTYLRLKKAGLDLLKK